MALSTRNTVIHLVLKNMETSHSPIRMNVMHRSAGHNRILWTFTLFIVFFLGSTRVLSQEFGGIRYLGHFIPPSGGSYTAGCWGWTDTTSGREYALLGNYCGTAIVEITDVGTMVERDFIPGVCSGWREIGVHENYAYVVSEGGGGVQIIDLSYLPDSAHLVKSFTYSSGGNNITRSHTVHVKDGYLYLNGCANWSAGGIVIFSLADPENPAFRSAYNRTYIHDCFVRNDTIYGAAIYGVGLDIIDATVKTSPQYLYTITYPGAGTHNAATTIDGRYALTTDEIGSTPKTLKIWDMSSAPTFTKVAEYSGSPTAIVHNVFVRDSLAIMAYYTAGIRVVDISDPEHPVEIGGYDTYPGNDNYDYDGAWSVYPFFPSGKIIIGDMATGMYVVDLNVNAPNPPTTFDAYSDYQTPNSITLTWNDPTTLVGGNPLSDFTLQIFRDGAPVAEVDSGVGTYIDTGRTLHAFHSYTIRTSAGGEVSSTAADGAYAGGHPQPAPPQAFEVYDGTDGVLLQWINPSRQLDDTPLNDLAYVLVYRDGDLTDSIPQTIADTGQARSYTDSVTGYHSYTIRVRDNESPVNYSTMTSSGTGFGGLFLTYRETFDSVLTPFSTENGWDTTSAISASGGTCITDSPIGEYSASEVSYLTLPPVSLGDNPILSFRHIAIIAFGDYGLLEISRNNRKTFSVLRAYNWDAHPGWSDGTADSGDWETVWLDLASYANDTVNVRFRLIRNASVQADGWYVDDIYIGPSSLHSTELQQISSGWNIISLPMEVADGRVDSLYPGAMTEAYAYHAGYVAVDTLEPGRGYWLKFDSALSKAFSGTSLLRDTVDVEQDWNLIGTISAEIAAGNVTTIPAGIIASPFYEFDAGYHEAPTLEPGRGYWVKSTQPGSLILSVFTGGIPAAALPGPLPPAIAKPVGPDNRSPLSSVTVTDAAGHSRTLWLTDEVMPQPEQETFELPPVPPPGAFDIRFSGGGTLASFTGNTSGAPIIAQGIVTPVSVSWKISEGCKARLDWGTRVRDVSGEGSVTAGEVPLSVRFIPGPSVSGSVPAEFAFRPNYPNPFNPSTVLEFDIPAGSTVRLDIYNILGQLVDSPVDATLPPGRHTVRWNPASRHDLSGGVYNAVLSVSDLSGKAVFRESRKLLFVR